MIYQVQDPQGQVHEIEGPENASQDEIMKQAQALIPSGQKQPDMSGSFLEARAVMNSDASLGSKVWQGLQVPSQMASRGLNAMAQAVPNPEPTGNLPMDILKGTPRIAANTLAQVAPGFVSRASILTAGASKALQALRPVGSVVGQGVAGQLESATGANPGSLGRAWNDPSLIFAEGKQAASPLYEAGKIGGKMAENLANIPTKEQFLDVASRLADEGKLPPETALEGRKMAGKLLGKGGGKYTEDFLRGLIEKFDAIAKSNEDIQAGDAAYRRGIDAASLRRILPSNKYGSTSAFKTGIMAATGPIGKALLSPLVHGVVSTTGGLASKAITNPEAAIAMGQAYRSFIDKFTDGKQ